MLQRKTRKTQEEYDQRRRKANGVCQQKKKGEIKKKKRFREENEKRNFYSETKWFRQNYKPRLNGCKDKVGNKAVAERWTEH